MARTKTRRTRRRAADMRRRRLPRLPTLFRPDLIGAALVVLGVALLPYLLPLTSVLRSARDELVAAIGLHVFTVVVLLAALGVLLAFRRGAGCGGAGDTSRGRRCCCCSAWGCSGSGARTRASGRWTSVRARRAVTPGGC